VEEPQECLPRPALRRG